MGMGLEAVAEPLTAEEGAEGEAARPAPAEPARPAPRPRRIEVALREHGSASRRELRRRVGARYWGPGRFADALREAVAEGRAKPLPRGQFAPVEEPSKTSGNGTE